MTLPRVTVERVRQHLEENGERLGRPVHLSQFISEAIRSLIRHDVEWLEAHGLLKGPGLEGEEAAATWDAPPSKGK